MLKKKQTQNWKLVRLDILRKPPGALLTYTAIKSKIEQTKQKNGLITNLEM